MSLSWDELPEHLAAGEVAQVMRVTERTVKRWIHTGQLPSVKIGGLRRVTKTTLRRFAAQRQQLRRVRCPHCQGTFLL